MPIERFQRQIERLLDDAEAAVLLFDWEEVRHCAHAALAIDPEIVTVSLSWLLQNGRREFLRGCPVNPELLHLVRLPLQLQINALLCRRPLPSPAILG